MNTYTKDELVAILDAHVKWLSGQDGGKYAVLTRAVLTGADLTGADLTGAVLTRAVLTGADLTDADLTRADLARAVLTGADLTDADLTRADLTRADLTRAVLTDADLTGAVLTRADLTDAVLTGAVLTGAVGVRAPIVPNIDAAILACVEGDKAIGALKMDTWHSCDTTHCRAGWAIHLAGDGGYALEDRIGPAAAGALIYAASRPGVPVPDFYASNASALADIRKCAGVES